MTVRQLLLRRQDLNHHQASYASSAHRCSGEYALNRHNVTSSDCYQDSGTFSGIARTRLWRSGKYSGDFRRRKSSPGLLRLLGQRLKQDFASSSSTHRPSGEYALDRHNVTCSGCYQDSGTSSGNGSHEIMAVQQLLLRLRRPKSSP